MDYTARYNGTFCTTKPIKKKRVLTPEQKELRDFYKSHSEVKPNGDVVIRVTVKKV